MRRRNIKLKDYSLHGAKINCARFSRKLDTDQNRQSRHEYFATGDNQNNIRFYQFLSEEDNELQSFNSSANNAVQSQVSAVSISWDQTCVISGSSRGVINVWDVLQGKNTPICTLKGHATQVKCFGLFPAQQNLIASGSSDTQIKLWDHRQKQNFATLKGHTNRVNSIQISPDGSCLLSGSQDGTTKLWDILTQKVIYTYSQHNGPVLKAIFHPQDRLFASCSSDRTAKYFSCDVSKKVYEYISSTQLVTMPITAIDFNSDGSLLCTGGNEFLKIWHMRKNGLLVQSIDSAWKGVQDLIWCENGVKGVSSYSGVLSVWFCYLGQKKQTPEKKQEQELKLPKIFKNPSIRKQTNTQQQRKIKPAEPFSSKQIQQNPKLIDRNRDLQQVMKNVNLALNNVAQLKNNREKQQAKKQQEKQRRQQERIRDEERKQKIRIQKQKQKQQKQAKQRQRRQRIQKQKQQEQRKTQQKFQKLQKQRIERQKQLQQKLHQTFERNNQNYQLTVEHDVLQNSSVMNISTFMGNGVQKQKLQQIQLIGQFMKQSGRFESVFKMRSTSVKPIIHLWKEGKIDSALNILSSADIAVAFDCINAILHNSTFKMAIIPDVACSLIAKLVEIMHNKHSTYVKNSMLYLNEIVLMFKDELIKVKMFNPMTRVDLSREQRLAKYDKLTQQFLNVFKQERLKKYATQNKGTQNEQLHNIAAQLYKNLEQLLRKIMPRKEPQAA